jgi:hypothetical protein
MKNLTTPHVVVIVAFLACVFGLVALDKDTGAFIALGVALLGAAGLQLGQTIAVKENTNGNQTKTLEMLEANNQAIVNLAHLMASMTPGVPDPGMALAPVSPARTVEIAAPTWTPDQEQRAA